MGKQITLQNLQTSLDRTKSYVDSRANANVIQTETVLFTGTADAVSTQYPLTGNVADYDKLVIYCKVATNADPDRYIAWQGEIDNFVSRELYDIGIYCRAENFFNMRVTFTTNTSFYINWVEKGTENNNAPMVYKVVGIKYAHPVEYTTTEKVIGTYLGKTLYEKTLTNINVAEPEEGQATNVLLTPYGIEGSWTVVDYEGVAQITTGSSIAVLPYAYARSDGTYDATLYVQRTSAGQWTINNTRYGWNVKALTLRYVKEQL